MMLSKSGTRWQCQEMAVSSVSRDVSAKRVKRWQCQECQECQEMAVSRVSRVSRDGSVKRWQCQACQEMAVSRDGSVKRWQCHRCQECQQCQEMAVSECVKCQVARTAWPCRRCWPRSLPRGARRRPGSTRQSSSWSP
jgi:hypothetical protein